MRSIQNVCLMVLLASSSGLFAEEISLISGFYRSEKADGGTGESTISIGARYGMGIEERKQWFIDGLIASTSYSGDNAPDGGMSFSFGGGQYYFLRSYDKDLHTYLAWAARFANSKESTGPNTETETNGLLYSGHAGFRFDFSRNFFFEINAQLFESALTASTTTTTTAADGTTTESKTSRTELYVQSFNGVDSLRFGLGYIF